MCGDCRQKLESSQKTVEPVPLIGFLTGLLYDSHFIHKLYSFITDSSSSLALTDFVCVEKLQRKLWSFWLEHSHGTPTYRDREVKLALVQRSNIIAIVESWCRFVENCNLTMIEWTHTK